MPTRVSRFGQRATGQSVHPHDAPRETGIAADGDRHERDAKQRERDGKVSRARESVHDGAFEV